jgi:ADP-heptose:LPS heptosyltransferase
MALNAADLNNRIGASLWKGSEFGQKSLPNVSPTIMREFGISKDNLKMVENLETLRESPPNIIIATGRKNFKFIQNYFREQTITKGVKYVMNFGIFQQLFIDKRTNQKLLEPSPVKFKNLYKPYLGQELKENSELLVFRTGGIGDLLFIQPNLRYLKQKYPSCTIRFACGPQYHPMVEQWEDCVDILTTLPFPFDKLISADYHMLFEGVIERCKEAEKTNAYRLFTRWLGLNLPDELLVPKQNPKEELVEKCKKLLKSWNKPNFIVLQLRASSPVRSPSHNFWIKIINGLTKRKFNVVITDSSRQSDSIDKLIVNLKRRFRVFNFAKYSESIAHTIALTSLSNGAVSTDSSLVHIAASLDKPIYGIYGPFPGSIRLDTYPKTKWVDVDRFCAPCCLHGQRPCKYAGSDGYSPCYDQMIRSERKKEEILEEMEKHFRSYD